VSHGAIAALFASASAVALALLAVGVRRARAAGALDASTVLTLATGTLFVLPDVLVAITGTLVRQPDVFGDLMAINPGWYTRVNDLALLLLAGLAAFLLIPGATSRRATVNAAGVLAILLWTLANLASGLNGGTLVTARGVVLLLCLMAATVLPRGRGACLGGGIFGVLLAAAGGLLSLFRYDVTFFVPCEGACNGLGFTGALPNENLLAIVLTASLPMAYLGFRGRIRFWLSLYLLGMTIATGSRTGIAAGTIVFVALLLVRPGLDRARSSLAQSALAWLVFAGSVVSSVYIVRHHWPSTALTTRPALWSVAWHYIDRSPWFGYGPSRWGALYRSSEIPVAAQRTSHNQWTDVLFVAGGVGAAVFVAMVLAAIWSAGRARTAVLILVATIFLIGTTEGAWAVGAVDLMSFSLVAVILTGPAGAARRTARVAPAPAPRGLAPPQLARERPG
jgi:O-Antigen ligase